MTTPDEKSEITRLKNMITGLNREISHLRKQNKAMAAEKKMLDEILDNLPGTFYIWDDRPRLVRWNRRHEEITEYSGDEYPSMQPTDFFNKREHRAIEKAVEKTFTEGQATLEATLVTKSGKEIPHVYTAVRSMIGQKPVVMGFGIDVSEQKRAEIKLRQAYADIKKLKDQLEAECAYFGEEINQMYDFGNIVGNSEVMKYVLYSIHKMAPSDGTVLILGESGTGKELVARAMHRQSRRNHRPLIKVDCAVLPTNLIESELFGHEKGAFTGALDKRIGRFEMANGATLFLDEIGELPLEVQKKLLRVLQGGEYERVGSARVMRTDVRVIAATNRDLEADVRRGLFRKDLWYRLNVLPLTLPPLRDRAEDIPLLVDWIIGKTQRRIGRQIRRIPNAVMEELVAYPWPGNVRELENVIERAMVFSHGDTLQMASPLCGEPVSHQTAPAVCAIKTLVEIEKGHILRALESTLWKISGKGGAAELLGINASTLRARMLKHGMRRPSSLP